MTFLERIQLFVVRVHQDFGGWRCWFWGHDWYSPLERSEDESDMVCRTCKMPMLFAENDAWAPFVLDRIGEILRNIDWYIKRPVSIWLHNSGMLCICPDCHMPYMVVGIKLGGHDWCIPF